MENQTCIIFDLDGTLLDTSPGIIECVKYAAKKRGYPQLQDEQLRAFIGPPLRDSFMRFYGCSALEAEALTAAYREHYREGALFHAEPYKGIFDLLAQLRRLGFQRAVATSKPQAFAEQILSHFGFEFPILHGADLQGRLSKADLIRLCMQDAERAAGLPEGIKPEYVMIGDTEHDAKGAENAGIPFLGVSYGFGNPDEMAKFPALGMARTPLDVLDLLNLRKPL